MATSLIKKIVVGAALSLAISFQLVAPAAAATNQEILAGSKKGVEYLAANQGADGGVAGYGDVTDWAVIAVAAASQDQATFNNGGVSAIDYLLAHPLTSAASATDVEKRILAIAAANEDTTNFGGIDYNTIFASFHNNQQIGNPTFLNDDIFGLIAAAALDDPALTAMAQDALDYLIANQETDGGFSYTITDICPACSDSDSNDTAAAIIALQAAEALGLTNVALADATTAAIAYLLGTQQADGGFGYDPFSPSDGSSTAWALMALNTVGSDVATEAAAARDWLLANQNTDGGFSYGAFGVTNSDVYTSAHAVVGLLGTTWLLQPEPLQPAPTPVTPAPAPSAPVVQTVTVSSPPQINNPNPQPQPTPTPQTLSDTTAEPSQPTDQTPTQTQETEPPKTEAKKSGPNLALLGTGVLVLVAVIWFVLQSKTSAGKK